MTEAKKRPKSETFDKDRREALKKLGALGIAAATAPAMLTLLQATQASAQSDNCELGDGCIDCCTAKDWDPNDPVCQDGCEGGAGGY